MLTANELRIGNYYLQDMINGCCAQITVEDIANLIDDPLDDFYQPIPITEEWLIKFGFTFTNGYDEKGLSYKSFYKFTKVDGFTKGVSGMLNIKSIINPVSISTHSHIQYVHQLQNLYFALTNEELICN